MISIKNLNHSFSNRGVLNNINFTFEKGRFYGLIGPNGSGKTTLLRLISKILKADDHTIFIAGQDIIKLRGKKRARYMAMVPQIFNIEVGFTVEEIVSMGRYPYRDGFGKLTDIDYAKVKEALEKINLMDYQLRQVNTLSGGELQRVILARAIVQETPILLLDEPLSHLDIHHQLDILKLTKELCEKEDKTVICVMHDLNLAMKYCDQVILLKKGNVYAAGETRKVITKEHILHVYGIEVNICEINGQSVITY